MRYKYIGIILLVVIIFFYPNLFSQDLKMEKSVWENLIEDLRLRKNSLELEREFLKDYLSTIKELDSLKNLLEKCREQNKFKQNQDTLQNNQDLLQMLKKKPELHYIFGKSEIIRGLIKLNCKKSVFGMNYKFNFSNFF